MFFFIDFDGHLNDANAKRVMDAIQEVAFEVRPLGSYPKSIG